MNLIRLTGIMFLIFLTGCALSPVVTPQQEDRLTGLIQASQLRPGAALLTNTSNTKLAVVYSVNLPKSLEVNTTLLSRFTGFLSQLFTLDFDSGSDAAIVLSSDRLLKGLTEPLRERFQNVVIAKDIRDGFTQGADLVAVLDLRLAYEFHEDPNHKLMNFTHTANASYLFVNRRLEQGPDLIAYVSHKQSTPATGAEANNRDFLVNVREARVKMLKTLSQEFEAKTKR